MTNTGAPDSPKTSLRILIVSDGKPGHLNQSLGLAEALKRALHHARISAEDLNSAENLSKPTHHQQYQCEYSDHPPLNIIGNIALAWGRAPEGWPEHCDLVIGAGHACHLTILAASRYYQAKSIVLMKPSLPRSWFDFCVAPKHDGLKQDARTLLTEGALNPVCYQGEEKSLKMILIGGPSKHFEWQEEALIEQLQNIIDGGATTKEQPQWLLLTSRRTPDTFSQRLQDKDWPVSLVRPDDVPKGWLAEQFPKAAICWVSPDSVSMVYEALTAEAQVGLLELAASQPLSRVAKGVQQLAQTDNVDSYALWLERGKGDLQVSQEPFNQADKIARQLLALNVFGAEVQ